MTRTGLLGIELGESRLEGTLLAVLGGTPTPLGAATTLIRNNGLGSGDRVTVTGEPGSLGGLQVLFISEITAASETTGAVMRGRQGPAFDLSAAETLPEDVSPDLDPRLQWWLARRQAGEGRPATSSTEANEIAVVARVTRADRWEALSEVRTPTTIGRTPDKEAIVTGRIPISRIEAVRAPAVRQEPEGVAGSRAPAQRDHDGDRGADDRSSCRPQGDRRHRCRGRRHRLRRRLRAPELPARRRHDAAVGALGSGCAGLGVEPVRLRSRASPCRHQSRPPAAESICRSWLRPHRVRRRRRSGIARDARHGHRGRQRPRHVGPRRCAERGLDLRQHLARPRPAGSGGGWKSFGDSVRLLEAAKYIYDKAGTRPCVINVSLGTNGGPHDGSTLVEQGLDALLAAKPNRALTVAAANSFADGVHAAGKVVANGTVELKWQVLAVPQRDIELEVWYGGRDRFTVELVDPSGVVRATVAPGLNKTLSVGHENRARGQPAAGSEQRRQHDWRIHVARHCTRNLRGEAEGHRGRRRPLPRLD